MGHITAAKIRTKNLLIALGKDSLEIKPLPTGTSKYQKWQRNSKDFKRITKKNLRTRCFAGKRFKTILFLSSSSKQKEEFKVAKNRWKTKGYNRKKKSDQRREEKFKKIKIYLSWDNPSKDYLNGLSLFKLQLPNFVSSREWSTFLSTVSWSASTTIKY